MNAKKSSFLRIILTYRKQIIILSLLSLFSSAFLLISPFISRLFIDQAFINKNLKVFFNLSFLAIILFIFSALFKAGEETISKKIALRLKLNLASRFVRKIYSLDFEFFQAKSVGENAYRLFDIERVVRLITEEFPNILVDIIKLPIILGIAVWVNLRMTALLIILSPLFVLRSIYLQKKLGVIYEEIWQASVSLSKEIHEAFSRILIIKALGLESFQRQVYLRLLVKNIRLSFKNLRWLIVGSLTSSFLSKAIYGAITLYGGWLIIKGRISLGSYAAVMLYLTQLGSLLDSLSRRFEYSAEEIVSLKKFFEIMDMHPKIKDLAQARALDTIQCEIEFSNVWFGYQKEKPVFKGINFIMPANSWIAVVGPSGCGKTTLISLILRLYEPWQGKIVLDGSELNMLKLKSLRQKIAIATQQPLLFDISIRENITYGLRDVNQQDLADVAGIACVDDFVSQLPSGYDTVIGEDACRLSHGMKQRIAIARAVLRKPHLLILDEAVSSVDSFTEERIFRGLRQKREGLGTIIISHRLSSIKDADRIYFLRGDGEIEEGPHVRLLTESALYSEFFHNQTEKEKIIY